MKFLTNNEIIDLVKKYLNNAFRYAILIDGEWGSGKTYFAKNILRPKLMSEFKDKKIIYMSLYGICTTDELLREIFFDIVPLKFSKNFKRLGGTIGKMAFAAIQGKFNIKLPTPDWKNIIKLENCILILDDLERVNMNMNALLGFINNFVEHYGTKTILIANEQEIKKLNIHENLELKYMVALNENIKFKELDLMESKIEVDKTLSGLKKKTNYLFNQNLNYNQIKEKVVGITIKYKPNLNELIFRLVKIYIVDENLQKKILDSQQLIEYQLKNYKHNNLRTVLFILEKFEVIWQVVNKMRLPDNLERRVLDDLLHFCCILCIKYKKGDNLPKWNLQYTFGRYKLGDDTNMTGSVWGFKFAYDFIINSYINPNDITKVVREYIYYIQQYALEEDDPVRLLENGWYIMEGDQLTKYMESIYKRVDENKYNCSLYPRIIEKLVFFEKHGIGNLSMDNMMSLMLRNIAKQEFDCKQFDRSGVMALDASIEDEVYSFLDELESRSHSLLNKSKERNIDEYIEYYDGWANELYKFMIDNEQQYMKEKKFFSYINIHKLYLCIKKSKNREIYNFRRILKLVYQEGVTEEDKEVAKLFINDLKRYYDECNNMPAKRLHISLLVEDVINTYNIKF